MDPIIILTGPTAVGKTDLSVMLAERCGGEIISSDSRQIYRELSVGTAKPPPEVLRRVPHHFINELSLPDSYSAGRFQEDAHRRISEIRGRGRVPIVVGGSTLYIHALKHGLADVPTIPPETRRRIEQRLQSEGAPALYRQLKSVDPTAAKSMDPTKTQRLIRALEVYEATGRTLTSYHEAQPPVPYAFKTVVLYRDRTELYERINRRVDVMLSAGLIDEVCGLCERGFDRDLNPLRTIGYQESIAFLSGEIGRAEMVRLIKRNTRRYAKRQLTWFRRDPANIWVAAASPPSRLLDDLLHVVAKD